MPVLYSTYSNIPTLFTLSPLNTTWLKATDDDDSQLREWSSFIGIVTAIVGNILISFALNLQRYAHVRISREAQKNHPLKLKKSQNGSDRGYGAVQSVQENIAEERERINLEAPPMDEEEQYHPEHPSEDGETNPLLASFISHTSESTMTPSEKKHDDNERPSYLTSPYWWTGIILMTLGETGNFLAYGFAPASIVSPLGVVALISNCIIAPIMLKESFRQKDFWGVLVAIGGAVTVVLSARSSEEKMGPHDLWSAITRWEFEAYLGIVVFFILVLMWASGIYGQKSLFIDIGLVGLFGGFTALSTKGLASLLSDTLWRTLTFPITYLLGAILVTSALMQIRYINRALQRFNSTQVIPTQFVFFTISVIIGSAVLYRDFESMSPSRGGKFFGGCVMTFLGVYLITSGRPQTDDMDNEGETDEEGTIGLVDEESYHDDVGTQDGQSIKTRQNSKASPPIPFTPFHEAESVPRTPSITLTTPDEDSEGFLDRSLPATPSPFHNPWLSSREELASNFRSLVNTTSSPVLPSEARLPVDLETPRRNSHQLQSPLTQERTSKSTLSRASLMRILGGPLASPLPSSSLSAIVADNIRRGLDVTPSKKKLRLKRRRPHLNRAVTTHGEAMMDEPLERAHVPLFDEAQTDDEELGNEEERRPRRGRSLSGTLGRFFSLHRDVHERRFVPDLHESHENDP
ncbi:MAG: hypothetical protein M1834_007994 [Cirrosporium novae-zelandiae]|nr:MAG: hypothetical protein M1834_007994 [Cirrosporium novae-zelandiae]